MPLACPSCGTAPVEKGPFTVCPNHFACRAQLKGRIAHFGSRGALDIEGLGEETASMLVDEGLVKELADLFDLKTEDLVPLEGFAEVSARNLVDGIVRRREVELARFLVGLGIPEVGVAVARDLAVRFRDMEALRAASAEALEEIHGVGEKMSAAIRGFLGTPDVREALDRLLAKGVPVQRARGGEGGGGGGFAGEDGGSDGHFSVAFEGRMEAGAGGAGRPRDGFGERPHGYSGDRRESWIEAREGAAAGGGGAGREGA